MVPLACKFGERCLFGASSARIRHLEAGARYSLAGADWAPCMFVAIVEIIAAERTVVAKLPFIAGLIEKRPVGAGSSRDGRHCAEEQRKGVKMIVFDKGHKGHDPRAEYDIDIRTLSHMLCRYSSCISSDST